MALWGARRGEDVGDDKFEIRPMGADLLKIGGAETDPEDLKLAYECWQSGFATRFYSGNYDLVVLDEINYTHQLQNARSGGSGGVAEEQAENVHVICTGRNAHPKITELADLVTEMREVKHSLHKRHSSSAWYRLLIGWIAD